ncbi:CWF19-like protein Drn1p [[Candida] jaroonii]|uniref:CWF19-like protein Drn1p n=1 Tax=[Candida] jaroonii TaxID=467808 RepID=A0ACA9Y247_9ASCO|nr:CWF19-like protein Drn1p [[Candida] jaroonii]
MDKVKILVLNPSDKIDEIVTKSNLQHAKNGPFGSIILLNKVPKPVKDFHQQTYFFGEPQVVSDNLTSVKGLVKLSSGVTICFMGDGSEEIDVGKHQVDILVANDLPMIYSTTGNLNIDKMIKKTTPRYVFVRGEFKEYEPFEWDSGIVTRMISLAEEGQGKWFYAFNISSKSSEIDRRSLVMNPFTKKRQLDSDLELEKVEKKKAKVVTPDQCFFCLSNPNVETHMIVEINKLTYLTIAKGPLTRYNKIIPFAGHGILIPVEHKPFISVDEPVYEELTNYELKLFEKFKSKYPEFVPIFFEINLKSNIHYHKQFLPINERFLSSNAFEKCLNERSTLNNEKYNKNHKLKFNKVLDLDTLKDQQFIMFRVYESKVPTIYVCIIDDVDKSIDLQFPRRVLTDILQTPKRLYWDKCKQGKHQEMRECEEFKKFLL